MEETPAHGAAIGLEASIEARVEQPTLRSLMDYSQLSLIGIALCIKRPSL